MKQFRPIIALTTTLILAASLYGCGSLNSTAESQDGSGAKAAETAQTANETQSSSGTSSEPKQSGGGSESKDTPSEQPEAKEMITVSVNVDTSRAAEYGYASSFFNGSVQVEKGASVYDALKATGLSLSGTKKYVNGINGLTERGCNQAGSGWVYYVNGVSAKAAANTYILEGGESILWKFVFDLSEE